MILYSEGLIVRRIVVSEIWGFYFGGYIWESYDKFETVDEGVIELDSKSYTMQALTCTFILKHCDLLNVAYRCCVTIHIQTFCIAIPSGLLCNNINIPRTLPVKNVK